MTIVIITLVTLTVALFPAAPTVATIATLALQLAHCLPRTKWLRGWWTLAALAALFPWSEPKGYLAASVLLIFPGRARWPVFVGVAVAALLLSPADLVSGVAAACNTVLIGLVVFGLTRLSDLRSELHVARRELAARSVADERERISRDLDTLLGSALSSIIGLADQRRPGDILALARDTAARVRQAPTSRPGTVPPADMPSRLALPIALSALAIFVIGGLTVTLATPDPPTMIGFAVVVGIVGLQVCHLLADGSQRWSRHFGWTIPLQTALAYLPLIYAEIEIVNSLTALAAASALILVPGRTTPWAVFATIVLGELVVLLLVKSAPLVEILFVTVATVAIAIPFYGLALLTRLVGQVQQTRRALAEIAVANERRRISAEVHDLLGYSLSAIAVKAEVAARAPERADSEFRDITGLARRALSDVRTIPYDDPEMSLHVESASAREVLTVAGIDVRLKVDTDALAEDVDTLLATVLREAVTNILRHSRAHEVTIRADSTDTHVRLRVTNDGASPDTSRASGDIGNGIINLTTRVTVAGGELTTGLTGDGHYALVATHPLPDRARPGAGP